MNKRYIKIYYDENGSLISSKNAGRVVQKNNLVNEVEIYFKTPYETKEQMIAALGETYAVLFCKLPNGTTVRYPKKSSSSAEEESGAKLIDRDYFDEEHNARVTFTLDRRMSLYKGNIECTCDFLHDTGRTEEYEDESGVIHTYEVYEHDNLRSFFLTCEESSSTNTKVTQDDVDFWDDVYTKITKLNYIVINGDGTKVMVNNGTYVKPIDIITKEEILNKIDISDGVVSKIEFNLFKNETSTNFNNEKISRENADNTLQTYIDNEKNERQSEIARVEGKFGSYVNKNNDTANELSLEKPILKSKKAGLSASEQIASMEDVNSVVTQVNTKLSAQKEIINCELKVNSTNYETQVIITFKDGSQIKTNIVDLPIESVVVDGRYDSVNKKIILKLQSGNEINIPVAALVSGLVSSSDLKTINHQPIIATGGGNIEIADVEANVSDTATQELKKLKIDGTTYSVSEHSMTFSEDNPTAPYYKLKQIQVDSDIWKVSDAEINVAGTPTQKARNIKVDNVLYDLSGNEMTFSDEKKAGGQDLKSITVNGTDIWNISNPKANVSGTPNYALQNIEIDGKIYNAAGHEMTFSEDKKATSAKKLRSITVDSTDEWNISDAEVNVAESAPYELQNIKVDGKVYNAKGHEMKFSEDDVPTGQTPLELKTLVIDGTDYWKLAGGKVNSVNGQDGDVVIDKNSIGLGQVDNTSDLDKPMSNATKTYVDNAVVRSDATFRGNFNKFLDLETYAGAKNKNDYAVVLYDENHDEDCWRYKYDGTFWVAEYRINETPFTQDQWDAINSGVKGIYDAYADYPARWYTYSAMQINTMVTEATGTKSWEGNYANYESLTTKDSKTNYFITDKNIIYRNNIPYGSGNTLTIYNDSDTFTVNKIFNGFGIGGINFKINRYVRFGGERKDIQDVVDSFVGEVTDLHAKDVELTNKTTELTNKDNELENSITNAISECKQYTNEAVVLTQEIGTVQNNKIYFKVEDITAIKNAEIIISDDSGNTYPLGKTMPNDFDPVTYAKLYDIGSQYVGETLPDELQALGTWEKSTQTFESRDQIFLNIDGIGKNSDVVEVPHYDEDKNYYKKFEIRILPTGAMAGGSSIGYLDNLYALYVFPQYVLGPNSTYLTFHIADGTKKLCTGAGTDNTKVFAVYGIHYEKLTIWKRTA